MLKENHQQPLIWNLQAWVRSCLKWFMRWLRICSDSSPYGLTAIWQSQFSWSAKYTRNKNASVRIHDIRRTFGSYQALTGASLPVIGKSLGHKSMKSTQIYARLNLDPVRTSIEKATEAMFKDWYQNLWSFWQIIYVKYSWIVKKFCLNYNIWRTPAICIFPMDF